MIVRPEHSADFSEIAALVRAAFDSPVEPKLVEDLRGSPGYLPELALVAEDDEPVGHVMFTLTELENGTPILMLSPLAVRPDRQRERPNEGTPEFASQALPLPAYDASVRGRVVYPPAFDGL